MFSPKYKPLSVLGILIVSLTIFLCSPWTAMAQFGEQRLIPLKGEVVDNIFVPMVENIPSESQETTAFVVYGRKGSGPEVGISSNVDYRHIPNSDKLESLEGNL